MIYLKGQTVRLNFDKPSRLPVPDQLKQLNQTVQTIKAFIPSIDAYQVDQSDYLIDSQNIEPIIFNRHADLVKQNSKRHAEINNIAEQVNKLIEDQIYIEQLEQDNILQQIREAALKAQRESTIHAYNYLIIKILTLTK